MQNKNCGSSLERTASVINQIRGSIRKMIPDDVISVLFRNFHIINNLLDYLFNLVFIVFSFKY